MENLLWLWITLGSLCFIGIVVVIWYIITKQHFLKLQKNIKDSLTEIDELILKKYNQLLQITELTKSELTEFAKELAQFREIPNFASTDKIDIKQDISNQVSHAMKSILEKLKSHLKLKKDNEVNALVDQWIVTEESLEVSRKVYNRHVSNFNRSVHMFPPSLIASIKKYKRQDFFETESISV